MTPSPPPGLTVVVPTHNERDRVGSCLAALPASSNEVEVIVADDGSTDGTPAEVRRRFPHVLVLELPHGGSGVARNAAVEKATAERIAFLDADCVPLPGWLEAAAGHRGNEVVMGRVRWEAALTARLVAAMHFGEFLGDRPKELGNFAFLNVAGPTALFREHPAPELMTGQDRVLAWRMRTAGVRIRYDPNQACLHRIPTDWRSLLARQRSYARRFIAIRRVERDLPGARLARLGPLGAPLIAAARFLKDLTRMRDAALPLYAVPLLAGLRLLDVPVMMRESLRR